MSSKQISTIIVLLSALLISSCSRVKTTDENASNSVTSIDSLAMEISENNEDSDTTERNWENMTQLEFNEEYVKDASDYENIVNEGFQEMVSLLPKYKDLFKMENEKYKQYLKAVVVVAGFGEYGSSSPCYFSDVRKQGIELKEASYKNMLLYLQGKKVSFPKTQITNGMIKQAYQSFIASIHKDGVLFWGYEESELEDYKTDLKNEQRCWNEWISYRSLVSSRLPQDLHKIYDGCSNLTRRIKLRQVKNQNQALGVTGQELWKCILPENCSDKDLLEYPGFDKVWAKHFEDLDWYPTFEE